MSDEEKEYTLDWVWVPDDINVYVAGRIINSNYDNNVIVELENGEERTCDRNVLIAMNKSSLQRIVSDLTLLDEMSIPLILHCLRKRFESGKIYSAIGTILISINPRSLSPNYDFCNDPFIIFTSISSHTEYRGFYVA